jgi:hypothetical protein
VRGHGSAGKRREREETKKESTLFSVEIAQLNDDISTFTY